MATSSAPFSVLPILAYVVGAVLVAYLALRAYRFVNERRKQTVALPKPVSGAAAASKPLFSFGRTTGWDWRRWTVPTRWARTSSAATGKAATTAIAKNLNVELLPTTGLPPHPMSMTPTRGSTPQLVDLGSPPTPPLTPASTSPGFPSSPRTPSPSLFNQQIHHPHPVVAHKNLHYPSYPRSPSPHALLATTPPQKQHKRSRSLGGVPVRRLSGGQSGLRNKVDVEMHEIGLGHTRGTSREHLLIDFSSSGSYEDESGGMTLQQDSSARISPAVSDIGVLPVPSSYNNKVAVPRPMPLVDLGDEHDYEDDVFGAHRRRGSEDDAWKWFGPTAPSIVRAYDPRPSSQRMQSWAAMTTDTIGVSGKPSYPIPAALSFPKTEKLVDIPSSEDELALDSSKTLVDVESNSHDVKMEHPTPIYAIAVDPFSENYPVNIDAAVPLVKQEQTVLRDITADEQETLEPQGKMHSSPFLHPLQGFVQVEVKPLHAPQSTQKGLLFAEAESIEQSSPSPVALLHEVESLVGSDRPVVDIRPHASTSHALSPALPALIPTPAPILDFTNAAAHTQDPVPSRAGWNWDEVEDPWNDRGLLPEQSEPDEIAGQTEAALVNPDIHDDSTVAEDALVEKSPGGSLLPTMFAGDAPDEEVPELALDIAHVEQSASDVQITTEEDDEGEEEDTPKATPASVKIDLPETLPVGMGVPVIVVDDEAQVLSVEAPSASEAAAPGMVYPDPDLLPLPDLLLSAVDARLVEGVQADTESTDAASEKPAAVLGLQSQMPTPPASPPLSSPLRLSPPSPRVSKPVRSLPASPRFRARNLALGRDAVKASSRPASPHLAVSTSLPLSLEDENATPVAVIANKPLWAVGPTRRIGVEEKVDETETMFVDEDADDVKAEDPTPFVEMQPSSSLPGSFPESTSTNVGKVASSTIAARLAATTAPAHFLPSARSIIRQPLEIALAMQLRPGLGAGADPAWMVRFLMAMWGWMAIVASGQANY